MPAKLLQYAQTLVKEFNLEHGNINEIENELPLVIHGVNKTIIDIQLSVETMKDRRLVQ